MTVELPMREDALPQPVSPYGVTKLAAEQLCYLYFVNYGVPATSLRYFTVYGPRQRPDMAFHRFLKAALAASRSRSTATATRPGTSLTWTTRSAATIAAGDAGVPGRVYNIGGGSRVTVNHVIEVIGQIIGQGRYDRGASPHKKATCATRMRIRRSRERTWASAQVHARRKG